MEKIVCRLAILSDLPQIGRLRWNLQNDDRNTFDENEKDQFIKDFIQLAGVDMNAGSLIHWVCENGCELISVMSVRMVKKVPKPGKLDGCWGYLTNVYTLPEYRRRKIGGELLVQLKQWAKANGLELLLVWPSDESYSFYERAGFSRPRDPLIIELE